MNRRDFIKFMGVTTASTAAAGALAKIPEAESKIILLDKPKDIVIAKELPDVDFIISEGLIAVEYKDENQYYSSHTINTALDSGSVIIEHINNIAVYLEWYTQMPNFMSRGIGNLFTFDLSFTDPKYLHLMNLNGRTFKMASHTVNSSYDSMLRVEIFGHEVSNV